MLIVGDLGFGVVEEFSSRFPNRFLNAGVAEQNMTGMASGLASDGTRVFTYSIANFPTIRALEQIRNDICYHSFPVTIVSVGSGIDYGSLGYSHFAVEDISVMRPLPNLDVFSPADEVELRVVMKAIFASQGPSYLRLPKSEKADLPLLEDWGHIDRPRKLSQGNSKLLILSTGAISQNVISACNTLKEKFPGGLDVFSVPKVSPLGAGGIEWGKYLKVLTVEEHVLSGGFGSAVLEHLSNHEILLPVQRIGIPNAATLRVGSPDYIRKSVGLDELSLVKQISRALESVSDAGSGT